MKATVSPQGPRVCVLHNTHVRGTARRRTDSRAPSAYRRIEPAMEYDRSKPKSRRPFGTGAFFDYGLVVTRRLAARSSRRSPWRKNSLPELQQQSAEERWDAEGGNSQTRTARRAARYEL